MMIINSQFRPFPHMCGQVFFSAQRRKSTAHIYPHITLGGGGGGPRLQDRAYPEAKLHGSTKGHLSDSLLEACSF